MPVFDFTNPPIDNNEEFICTYTTFHSNERTATPEKPILVLDNNNNLFYGTTVNGTKEKLYELFELWNDC